MPSDEHDKFEHVYHVEGLHAPFYVYSGPLRVRAENDGQHFEETLDGCLEFKWLPRPHVAYHAETDGFTALRVSTARSSVVTPESAVWQPPPAADFEPPAPTLTGYVGEVAFDATGRADHGIAYVVNFPKFSHGMDLEHLSRRLALVLNIFEHRVTLVEVPRLDDLLDGLNEAGGYGFTHTVTVERGDGATIGHRQLEQIVGVLYLCLSFARGARCGIALPIARAGGSIVWGEYSCMRSNSWRNALTWLDPHHPNQLQELFRAYSTKCSDEYMKSVVDTAILYYLAANIPDPLEVAIATSQAGLEALAWSHLIGKRLIEGGEAEKLSAASRIRLFLHDAGIPTEMPDSCGALRSLAEVGDALSAIATVRNRFIHPKPGDDAVSMDARTQAWRMSQWFLELAILHEVGYQETYASRLIEGRWVGNVDPVPWASV